jgi:hypothetical protein
VTSWDSHVGDYLDAGAFVVRYEDMLHTPESECTRLLQHLGVHCSGERIRAAIARQSFANVKLRFATRGDSKRAGLLRQGSSGGWINALTREQSTFCAERFAPTLARLGYIEPTALARRGARTR